jgi:D-alanyl-D-alanine carboxypeptidase (penicillin-binding protein 5/6)
VSPPAARARRFAAPAVLALSVAALLAVSAAPGWAAVPRPDPDAKAAILVDARSGEVLLADGADERRSIASTTKLMTALLLMERARPDEVFTASNYQAAAVESQIGLETGERMRVGDLLTALLLASANDAAATIATNVSGSRRAFVREMNRRAGELGLRSTSYSNPVGLDSRRNRSSARDLASLARVLLRNPRFAATVDRPSAHLRSGRRPRTVRNRNTLIEAYPFVEGVKTGHTQAAGYVLVGAGQGRGAELVSVVLGAPNEAARNQATLDLLRWGIDQFRRVRVADAGRPVGRRPVAGRGEMRVGLSTPRGLNATLRRGRRPSTRLRVAEEIEGPLPARRRIGTLEVSDGQRVLATAPLLTTRAVPAPAPLAALRSPLGVAVALTLLVVIAIVVAMAVRARGRRARTPTLR